MTPTLRRVGAWAACCICVIVSASTAEAQTTALYIDSQPGDYVGQGEQRLFTAADFTFTATSSQGGSVVSIAARTDNFSTPWSVMFQAPGGVPLAPGVYENASSHSFITSVSPSLSVNAPARSCFRLFGRFIVYEIAFGSSGVVTRFAADFEQHCDGGSAALFGAVRFNALRSTIDPFDGEYPVYSLQIDPAPNGYVTGQGLDCGAGRTDCEETYGVNALAILEAIPSPGYVFLGWAGLDCVGGPVVAVTITRRKFCAPVFNAAPGSPVGESPDYSQGAFFLDGPVGTGESDSEPIVNRQVYVTLPGETPTSSAVTVASNTTRSQVIFRVAGPRNASWHILFAAPAGELLAPGTYEYTSESFATTAAPAFGISNERGSQCAGGGRFEVYEVVFTGSFLTSFAADFEAPCGPGLAAGSIRYQSTRASLLPFDGAYPLHALRVASTLGGYVTAPGISCGDGGRTDCQEAYAVPTNVVLRAFASPGYDFVGWGGSCREGIPITVVTVSAAIRCRAIFTPSAASASPADPSLAVATLLINSPGASGGFAPPFRLWLSEDSSVSVNSLNGGAAVYFTFTSASSGTGVVRFSTPAARLAVGDYDNAQGSVFGSYPALEIAACSVRMGRFRIYEATFDSGGNPLAFAADFEAVCDSSSASYVVGAVRFHSSRARLLPFDGAYPLFKLTIEPAINGNVTGPGIDCGPGRGDCTEQYASSRTVTLMAAPSPGFRFVGWTGACYGGSTTTVAVNWVRRCSAVFNAVQPGSGTEDARTRQSALFIDGRSGDPVGGGRRHVWLDAVADDTFGERNTVRLFLRVPEGRWSITFSAPGSTELRPGVYENATYPFTSTRTGPGILIESPWGWCSSGVSGRFTIHQISFSSIGRVESIAVDFEQRCLPDSPPFLGSLRLNSTRSELRPFPSASGTGRPGDFNGDGRVDLLWQNRADGRLAAWFMNGTTAADNAFLTPDRVADTAWHIVGSGDANLDGLPDLYWQHQTTGALSIWYMADTSRSFAAEMWPNVVSDTAWKIRTVVDMNGDRYPDLIWQHEGNGQVAVWFMQGGTIRTGEPLGPGQVADLNWKIVGAGDVDRDGTADLFWHHAVTGQLAVWFMRGRVLVSGQALAPDRVSDTAWQVRGVGDLDGNGSPDLIWQNTTTFQAAAWLLNGLRLMDGRPIAGPALPSADWFIVTPK